MTTLDTIMSSSTHLQLDHKHLLEAGLVWERSQDFKVIDDMIWYDIPEMRLPNQPQHSGSLFKNAIDVPWLLGKPQVFASCKHNLTLLKWKQVSTRSNGQETAIWPKTCFEFHSVVFGDRNCWITSVAVLKWSEVHKILVHSEKTKIFTKCYSHNFF